MQFPWSEGKKRYYRHTHKGTRRPTSGTSTLVRWRVLPNWVSVAPEFLVLPTD